MGSTFKPSGVGPEVGHTINSCTNVYGRNTPTDAEKALFGNANGTYNGVESWYFYDTSYYLDITINASCNLWSIAASDAPTNLRPLSIESWNGSSWVSYGTTLGFANEANWQKIFTNLPAGRYRFKQLTTGDYSIHGEWYLEANALYPLVGQEVTLPIIDTSGKSGISGVTTVDSASDVSNVVVTTNMTSGGSIGSYNLRYASINKKAISITVG